jgi:hypothetical protein
MMEATATDALFDIRDVLLEIKKELVEQNKNQQRFRSQEQARKRESSGF